MSSITRFPPLESPQSSGSTHIESTSSFPRIIRQVAEQIDPIILIQMPEHLYSYQPEALNLYHEDAPLSQCCNNRLIDLPDVLSAIFLDYLDPRELELVGQIPVGREKLTFYFNQKEILQKKRLHEFSSDAFQLHEAVQKTTNSAYGLVQSDSKNKLWEVPKSTLYTAENNDTPKSIRGELEVYEPNYIAHRIDKLAEIEKTVNRLYFSIIFNIRYLCSKNLIIKIALTKFAIDFSSKLLDTAFSNQNRVEYIAAENSSPYKLGLRSLYILTPDSMRKCPAGDLSCAREGDVIQTNDQIGTVVIIPNQMKMAALFDAPEWVPAVLFEVAMSNNSQR